MSLRFSTQPGRRERHLQRRHNNPLFGIPAPEASRGELDRARSADRQEAEKFEHRFVQLVQQAAGLQPNEDSEVILQLKESLDQAYEQACGLPGDWSAQKQAIAQLTALIMAAVIRGAGNDAQALEELDQEQTARAMHYRLLEHPLVADLLHPDAPVPAQDLAPTLLCVDEPSLQAALELFDPQQLTQLAEDAGAALANAAPAGPPPGAAERLEQIRLQLARNGTREGQH
jgi:hypothetical protein